MCIRCEISRRSMLVGGGALAASALTGTASARIRPSDMVPLIGPRFKPTEADEQGLWQQMDRVEEEVAGSNLLLKDGGIDGYVRDLIGKVGGPAAKDMRIYVARIPEFNAMMFPSGFAVIFSGLLLRMRSEAQLAGVIAHESGHFLRRHMIRQWRDLKRKSDIFSIGMFALGGFGLGTGMYMGNIAQLAQLGTLLSLFRYSRELEAEADAMGARLIAEAGYDPMEMSDTWAQLIGELDKSARYRRKHRDRGYDLFETHPAPESRLADPKASAAELEGGRGVVPAAELMRPPGMNPLSSASKNTGSHRAGSFSASARARATRRRTSWMVVSLPFAYFSRRTSRLTCCGGRER